MKPGRALSATLEIPQKRVSDIPEFSEAFITWSTVRGLMPTIRALSELHGDFATVKSNIIRLCNTGHTFSIVCPTKRDLKKAEEALNEFVVSVNPMMGGISGVINQLLAQLATDGAVSVEAEAEFTRLPKISEQFPFRIAAIHQVDVRSIKLEYVDKRFGYVPYQDQGGKDPVELPAATYQLQVFKPLPSPNPPYPVPPMIAGLKEAKRQREALASIDRAMQKVGLLGIMDATIEQPERYEKEDDNDYEARLQAILNSVVTMLGKSLSQGIYAHFGQLGFQFTNFGAEFAKTLPFLDHERQRMAQALQNDWASTQEQSAFLSIIYEKTLNEMVHYQHLVTGPLERYAKLNLALQGLAKGFTVLSVDMSLDQDSVRYWENELIKNQVAKGLVELGVDTQEALRYINVNIGSGNNGDKRLANDIQNSVLSSLKAFDIMHQRLYQGIFRYASHAQNGGRYTLEKVHTIKLSEL